MDPLMAALRRLRLRLFVTQWTRAVVLSLIVSTALACVWLLAARLFPKIGPIEPVSATLVGIGLVVASGYAIWKRPSVLKAALEADRRLGLQERIIGRFAKVYAEAGNLIEQAFADYAAEVQAGVFPDEEHSYRMPERTMTELEDHVS